MYALATPCKGRWTLGCLTPQFYNTTTRAQRVAATTLLFARIGVRLGLVAGALACLFVGGEALRAGVGYLLVGLALWLNIQLERSPRAPDEEAD